ncbi:PTS sugar transporter subunit IIA [Verrucomicrobia bacterium S94]|nr:PTS sugar transporter subunit IIA [Verrucomicrobia bacterium S94]
MNHQPIRMAVLAACGTEEEMFGYAELFAPRNDVRHHHVFIPGFALPKDEERAITETRHLAGNRKLDLIISEWLNNTRAMQDLLQLAQKRRFPVVFVRTAHEPQISRIVVATGGGPNVYEQMWLARQTAARLNVPMEILHWTPALDSAPRDGPEDTDPLEKMCLRLFGMQVNTIHCCGPDFTGTVADTLRPDDLLVIGAPSPLRMVADFSDSLPDQLARTVPNPMILLSTPSPNHTNLRRLLWGRLIKPRLHSRPKKEVLEGLIDNLIRHNQLPPGSRKDMLERALQREQAFSTAVDCETAFPHIKLPGFFGVAGTLGIFPDGIDFGSEDDTPTRFVYLLVTPEGFCDEYLAILSKISRRMLDPAVRKALLISKTAAEAVEILEPHQDLPLECTLYKPITHRQQKAAAL